MIDALRSEIQVLKDALTAKDEEVEKGSLYINEVKLKAGCFFALFSRPIIIIITFGFRLLNKNRLLVHSELKLKL